MLVLWFLPCLLQIQKEHVHLIHYPLYTTITKPCNYPLCNWGMSTRLLIQYHLNKLFSNTYTVFSSSLFVCLFVFCLLFVCLFVVKHTDDYSCIAIKTSANQISCYRNPSSQSHPTVKVFFIMWRKKHLTWLSNSAGLILAKRRKSMMVNCLAISSGSKSNKLRTEDKLEGNYKRNKHASKDVWTFKMSQIECT